MSKSATQNISLYFWNEDVGYLIVWHVLNHTAMRINVESTYLGACVGIPIQNHRAYSRGHQGFQDAFDFRVVDRFNGDHSLRCHFHSLT